MMLYRTASSETLIVAGMVLSLAVHAVLLGMAPLRLAYQSPETAVSVTFVVEPSAISGAVSAPTPSPSPFKEQSQPEVSSPNFRTGPSYRRHAGNAGQHSKKSESGAQLPHSGLDTRQSPESVRTRASVGAPTRPSQSSEPASATASAYSEVVWHHLARAAHSHLLLGSSELPTDAMTSEARIRVDGYGHFVDVEFVDEVFIISRQGEALRRFLSAASPYPAPPGQRPTTVSIRLKIGSVGQ